MEYPAWNRLCRADVDCGTPGQGRCKLSPGASNASLWQDGRRPGENQAQWVGQAQYPVGSKAYVEPTELVFNESNWRVPQTVRVVAFDDWLDEPGETHFSRVAHRAYSSDG